MFSPQIYTFPCNFVGELAKLRELFFLLANVTFQFFAKFSRTRTSFGTPRNFPFFPSEISRRYVGIHVTRQFFEDCGPQCHLFEKTKNRFWIHYCLGDCVYQISSLSFFVLSGGCIQSNVPTNRYNSKHRNHYRLRELRGFENGKICFRNHRNYLRVHPHQ